MSCTLTPPGRVRRSNRRPSFPVGRSRLAGGVGSGGVVGSGLCAEAPMGEDGVGCAAVTPAFFVDSGSRGSGQRGRQRLSRPGHWRLGLSGLARDFGGLGQRLSSVCAAETAASTGSRARELRSPGQVRRVVSQPRLQQSSVCGGSPAEECCTSPDKRCIEALAGDGRLR